MSGINLFNYLRALPIRLITHNMGAIDSIGTVVFLAGSERYANPHATFMFHGAARRIGKDSGLDRVALEAHLDSLKADQLKIASIIFDRANFAGLEEVTKLLHEQSTRGNAFALSQGIIHRERRASIPKGPLLVHFASENKPKG